MRDEDARCVHCERGSAQVPLLALRFQGVELWICSEHLPILIHKPEQLMSKIPGAQRLTAVEIPDRET